MAKTFISKVTASSSSSLSFTSGIDSTYDVYEWHFINMHPSSSGVSLTFQVNAVGQTGFNETIHSSYFQAYHNETDTATTFAYYYANHQTKGTAYQKIANNVGSGNDQSVSGILTLYAPSSTTYLKHFSSVANEYHSSNYTINTYVGGYVKTTSAIDEIDFKFASGNIDAGTIKMYGVS